MTKKERTFVFNICVLLYNLVLGLVIEGFLFLAVIFLISKNQNLAESIFSQIALPLVLLAGLITAMCLGLTSIIALLNLSNNNLLQSWDYVWGILIMFLCFGAMQRTVIAIYGLEYKDLIANLKNNR